MTLSDFIQEAENILIIIKNALFGVLGESNPFALAVGGLMDQIKTDVEAAKVMTAAGEQTLIMTRYVWDQVVNFAKDAKAGVRSGPLAADWKGEVLKVLALGIPIALEAAIPNGGPVVMLSEAAAEKLLELL